jgi:hypothetical protein
MVCIISLQPASLHGSAHRVTAGAPLYDEAGVPLIHAGDAVPQLVEEVPVLTPAIEKLFECAMGAFAATSCFCDALQKGGCLGWSACGTR